MPAVVPWDRETVCWILVAPRESREDSLADAVVGKILVLFK